MRLIPIVLLLVLAGSSLGYGMDLAWAQNYDQPATAGQPYAKICGDHPCKPGEVYSGGGTNSTTSSSTNATSTQEKVGISANAKATKAAQNATSSGPSGVSNQVGMSDNLTVTKTSGTPAPKQLSPRAQITAGTSPEKVVCPSGHDLVLNMFDSRPACIKSSDLSSFIARGWGKQP